MSIVLQFCCDIVEGEVQTYADLPPAADHLGEIWAVLTSTGIWPFNKVAGFYISNGVDWNVFSAFNFPSISGTSPITYDPSTGEISTSIATNRLVGRSTSGTGVMEQISLGTGLTLAAGTLNGTAGTVTTLSVASANGLAGTVSNPTTTPQITLSTSITGILKGNGTAISAAVAGTDYVAGAASSTDNALVRFDLTTGKVIQNSGIIVDDSNNITGIGSINAEGNLVIGRESDGSPVVSVVSNSGTGGVRQSVVAATGGDPQYNLATDSGTVSHSMGLDDSDSSKLKRQFSATVGTSSYEIVTQTGIVTHPLNPNFLATVTSTLSNVTGDGTNYTVIFGTEIVDYAANYDPTTGTFTAPVTGMYQFNAVILLSGLVAGNTDGQILLVTSNRTYNTRQSVGAMRDNLDRCSLQISQSCDMDAGDTCVIQILVSGGSKVTDILSGGASSFSGFLIG